jgi:IS605 OrfB family transposase
MIPWGCSLRRDVQITVVGKVYRPNPGKTLLLNRCLEEYHRLVKWYLRFASTSKTHLHRDGYEGAKRLFDLPTALIQTARDKTVEILKAFRRNKKPDSVLQVRRISIRFDRRCYRFSKTTNVLTPYWLTLSLRPRRISLPIVFGERQRKLIEEALGGEWSFTTVEMVKRNGEWYAHFVLKKVLEVVKKPKTVIGIDVGEVNLTVAVAISKVNPSKPMRGQFWRGAEIKRIRGLYSHLRRRLLEKGLLRKVKEMGRREHRRVNQLLHMIANEIVNYVKSFPKPIIVMEDLNGLRRGMGFSKRLNRRLHSLPFRRLQSYVEYKALLSGVNVVYVKPRNTSKTCYRCGHVARSLRGREFRCPDAG